MIFSFKFFPKIKILKLTPLKYGIMCAGLALSLNSSISYWYEMDHKTKLFVLSICLLSVVFLAIQLNKDESIDYDKQEIKREEEEDLELIKEELDSYPDDEDIEI